MNSIEDEIIFTKLNNKGKKVLLNIRPKYICFCEWYILGDGITNKIEKNVKKQLLGKDKDKEDEEKKMATPSRITGGRCATTCSNIETFFRYFIDKIS